MRPLLTLILPLFLFAGCMTMRTQKGTTAELQLRHNQLVAMNGGGRFYIGPTDLFGNNPMVRDQDEQHMVELELLHRWQSGDRAAYLPMFGH
jgi:hypothetical protein